MAQMLMILAKIKKHHYILHYKKGYKDIVEYLVSNGANVNVTDNDGWILS